MAEPRWLTYARTFNGLMEYPGPATNHTIAGWLKSLKAWWSDDQTAWCGTFVAHCMQHYGIELPKNWFRAKDWASWGKPCPPCVGAIGVKSRVGGGHVFFVVGQGMGVIYAYGGNQGDKVCTIPIRKDEVEAYRWPASEPLVAMSLPQMAGGKVGASEA